MPPRRRRVDNQRPRHDDPMELAVFGAACAPRPSRRAGLRPRVLSGSLMTALDMHGVSLSAGARRLLYLEDLSTRPAARRPCQQAPGASRPLRLLHSSSPRRGVVDDFRRPRRCEGDLEDTERAVKAIRAACEAVLKAEAELTALDEKVGDGDAGTTLAAGAKAVLEARDAGLPKGASGVAAAVARAVEDSMGGSSGVLAHRRH